MARKSFPIGFLGVSPHWDAQPVTPRLGLLFLEEDSHHLAPDLGQATSQCSHCHACCSRGEECTRNKMHKTHAPTGLLFQWKETDFRQSREVVTLSIRKCACECPVLWRRMNQEEERV